MAVKKGDRVVLRGKVTHVAPDAGLHPGTAEVLVYGAGDESMGIVWVEAASLEPERVTMNVTTIEGKERGDDHAGCGG